MISRMAASSVGIQIESENRFPPFLNIPFSAADLWHWCANLAFSNANLRRVIKNTCHRLFVWAASATKLQASGNLFIRMDVG